MNTDVLERARRQVLLNGRGLTERQTLECLRLPDERVGELIELAHQVRGRNAPSWPGNSPPWSRPRSR